MANLQTGTWELDLFALNSYTDFNERLSIMKPKVRVILEQSVEEGVRHGYYRAYKHTENPTEEHIVSTIEDCVMESIYQYFSFDDEDYQ
jgi:hypothetical protein